MFNTRVAPWLAFVPGLGHLVLGRRAKGIHLLVSAFAAGFVLLWRADRIMGVWRRDAAAFLFMH